MIKSVNIPTADFIWNPLFGCHHCSGGSCKSILKFHCDQTRIKMECWAYKYVQRYRESLARREINWHKDQREFCTPAWYARKNAFIKQRLKYFSPILMHSQLELEFPFRPSLIATCHMGDIKSINTKDAARILARIKRDNAKRRAAQKHCHVFQFLTRNPLAYVNLKIKGIPNNCWLGITATSQDEFEDRLKILNAVSDEHLLYVNLEPLLGPIEIKNTIENHLIKLDWVIVGGMTGPDAKPLRPKWLHDIIADCQALNIPLYFKGWGNACYYCEIPDSARSRRKKLFFDKEAQAYKRGKPKSFGATIDGKEYKEFPEWGIK